MGSRVILVLKEKDESSYFFAYHGANALSPLLRLYQAKELQSVMPEHPSIAQEDRERYWRLFGQSEDLDDEEMEER